MLYEVITDAGNQKTVDLGQTRVDLWPVVRTVLHVFTAIDQTGQNVVETVGLFLVHREQPVQIVGGKLGFPGFRHAEHFRMIGGHVAHVGLQAIEYFFFFFIDIPEKSGLVVMDFGRTRRCHLELGGRLDQLLDTFFVKISFGSYNFV